MSYWLIEHYDYNQPDGHRWLRIWTIGSVNGIPKAELTWANDAQTALRFSRKQDAEHFALLHRDWCVLARITEHADMTPDAGVQACQTCGRGAMVNGKCDRCGAPEPVPAPPPLDALKRAEKRIAGVTEVPRG